MTLTPGSLMNFLQRGYSNHQVEIKRFIIIRIDGLYQHIMIGALLGNLMGWWYLGVGTSMKNMSSSFILSTSVCYGNQPSLAVCAKVVF